MIESIKITSLNNIGSNLSYTSIFPIVNMSGTPDTQKANLQIIGNYILSQAGSANFVQAAQATLAQSVTNAAQPNITSVGTLSSLDVSGNLNISVDNLKVSGGTNGYVLQTDGAGNLTWTAQTGNGGNGIPGGANTQIQFNDAGVFGGSANLTWNATYNTLVTQKISVSNVINSSGSQIGITPGANANGSGKTWSFDSSGGLYWPAAGGGTWVIESNNDGEFEIRSTSNVVILANTTNSNAHFTFSANDDLIFPAPPGGDWHIGPSDDGTEFSLHSHTNLVVYTNVSNSQQRFNFDSEGTFTAPGNVVLEGTVIAAGPGAVTLAQELSFPSLVISSNSDTYIQAAINNVSDIGSADWAAYGHHGNDQAGWADMGFTSSAFSDPNYTITGGGDGYFFAQGYLPAQAPFIGGGNLVIATGDQGTTKDIVFATGGFLANNEFARFEHSNNAFSLNRSESYIKFAASGTISNPANSSLDPLIPNVSTMVLTPDQNYAAQALVLDPTAPGHIHLRGPSYSGNIDEPSANVFLGGELSSFEVGASYGSAPNVFVHSGGNTWTFSNNGLLTLPGGNVTIGSTLGGEVILSNNTPIGVVSQGNAGTVLQWSDDIANTSIISAIYINSPFGSLGDIQLLLGSPSAPKIWTFNSDGSLKLPGNTIDINFANGVPVFEDMVQWTTAPVSNTSAGTAGQAAYDSGGNLFVCVSTNTWAKFAGTTSW